MPQRDGDDGLFNELSVRAKALGYRLVKRDQDYLLWGVHQRRPVATTHTAATLDGDGGIADMLDGIAQLPRYCLQLHDNPRVCVVAQSSGREIVKDTLTGEFFKLWPNEHDGATRIIVHAKHAPPIGNWAPAEH